MDAAETERMKAIERRVTKIPDIKKTGSIIVSYLEIRPVNVSTINSRAKIWSLVIG